MISTLDSAALLLAGTAAGLIGSAEAITSLVSYPALLAVGLPALPANIANNVPRIGCWPGSALASKARTARQSALAANVDTCRRRRRSDRVWTAARDPIRRFARVVPFLVAAGSLTLLFEPRLTAWRQHHDNRDNE
jgi:hypothetical protein